MNVKAMTEYARAFEWFSFGEKREARKATGGGHSRPNFRLTTSPRGELPQITRFKVLNELIR